MKFGNIGPFLLYFTDDDCVFVDFLKCDSHICLFGLGLGTNKSLLVVLVNETHHTPN
jgi:hypothetical protein